MAQHDEPNTLLDTITKWINTTFSHKLVNKDLLQKFCSDSSNPIEIPCNSFQDILNLIDKNNSWNVLPFILEQDWNLIKQISSDYKLKLIEQLRLKPLYDFHIFYTIIRWGDCDLLDLLITDYKLDDYASNDDSGKQLDLLISDHLKLLMLRRVVIGNEIKQKCEKILFEINFITKEPLLSNIEISVDERIEFVLNRIDELVLIEEVNSLFLLAARAIADNLFVLKDKVKKPLDQLPWGHMEFYISVFLHKFDAGYKLTLTFNMNKLINYLILFKDELNNIKKNSAITDGSFDQFYKEFELNRSFLALTRIARYMKAIDTPCSDDVVMRLAIERCVQVTGENLKSSDMSPNISAEVEKLFEVAAPNFLESIRDMRDALSHVEYMESRLKIVDEIYLKLKMELKSIYPKILDFIFMQQYYKFECFIDTEIISVKKFVSNSAPYLDDYLNPELLKVCLIDDDTTGSNEKLLHCFCKNIKAKDRLDLLQLLLNVIDNIHNVDNIEEFFILSTPETRNYLNDLYKILTNNNKINLDNYCKMLSQQPEVHLEANIIQENIKKVIRKICINNNLDYEIFNECIQCGDLFKSLIKSINKNSNDAKDLFESIKNQTKIELFHNNLPSNRKDLRVFTNQLKNLDYEDASLKITKLYLKEHDKNKNDKIFKLFNTLLQTIYNTDISNSVKTEVKNWLKQDTKHLIQNVCNSLKHLLAHNSNDELHRAALEMCNLDILELYKDDQLSNNNAPFYESYPILLGKVFRNHLAHYNVSFDRFSNDHSLLLTANKLVDPNFSTNFENSNSKIGTIIPITFKELVNNYKQSELIILNQIKLYKIAQNGTLENFQENLLLSDIASNLNNKNVAIHAIIGDNLNVFKYLLNTTKFDFDLKKLAIQHNSVNILKLLINLDGIKGDELHYAVLYNQLNIAKTLLELVNSKSFHNKLTPLHLACLLGRTEMVTLLIQNGAELESRDAKYNAPIHSAAIMNYLDGINLLIQHKAEITSFGFNNKTALHFAAGNGYEELVKAILSTSSDINIPDINNQTPLHLAARCGYTNIIQLLLQHKAKTNLKDKDGNTALHLAAIYNNSQSALKLLIASSTNLLEINIKGNTILHLIQDCEIAELLPIKDLLDSKNKLNRTPLHCAVINNQETMVKLLKANGANIYILDSLNQYPMHYAKKNSKIKKLVNFNNYVVGNISKDTIYKKLSQTHNGYLLQNHEMNLDNIISSLQYNYITNIEKTMAKINVSIKPLTKNDMLLHSAYKGDTGYLNELIADGADLETKFEDELNLLDVAAFNGNLHLLDEKYIQQLPGVLALFISASVNYLKGIDLLLRNGVDVNSVHFENEATALHFASERGHFEAMEVLINYGADVTAVDKTQRTTLHHAIIGGNPKAITLLLNNNVNFNAIDENTFTPLILAAFQSHPKSVELLLEKGADINKAAAIGWTPFYIAASLGHLKTVEILLKNKTNINTPNELNGTSLYVAALGGYNEIAELLIKHGEDINFGEENYGTPLYVAASNGHPKTIKFLLNYGADINKGAQYQGTPLYAAASNGHEEVVDLLLENGANIDAAVEYFENPLCEAAFKGKQTTIELLLKKGANINIKTKTGETPLYNAAHQGHLNIVELLLKEGADINCATNDGETCLYGAAHEGQQMIVQLLLDKGADFNKATTIGWTPIYVAASRGHPAIVNLLLDKGSSINSVVKYFGTPLYEAASNGHVKVVELLLEKGADINIGEEYIGTPLHGAALGGHANIIELLIKNGAKIDVTEKGNTPLHIAAVNGSVSCIICLLHNGANINAIYNDKMKPLHVAAQFNNVNAMIVLAQHGSDINETDQDGNTVFHIASENNSNRIIQKLLGIKITDCLDDDEIQETIIESDIMEQLKININDPNKNGRKALHLASQFGKAEIIELLLNADQVDVKVVDNKYWSALHFLIFNENISKSNPSNDIDEVMKINTITSLFLPDEINGDKLYKAVKFLLEVKLDERLCTLIELMINKGVDVNALNEDMFSALHYATMMGRTDCVEILVKSGADTSFVACNGYTAADLVSTAQTRIKVVMSMNEENKLLYGPLLERFNCISKCLGNDRKNQCSLS